MPLEELSSIEYIVVNATALDQSGALTILKQFISHAGSDHNNYLCFVPENLSLKCPDNIKLVFVKKKGWLSRVLWDAYALKKWLKDNRVNYKKLISLQNTTVNVDVQQIVYLHQSLPFSDVRWNILKKNEIILFLYKYFYSFFIFLFATKNTVYVVQSHWLKKILIDKHKLEDHNVCVVLPEVRLPVVNEPNSLNLHKEKFSILYPATPLVYKNHLLLLKSLYLIKKRKENSQIILNVTFKPPDYVMFHKLVLDLGLADSVNYLGVISYDCLIEKYKSADLVVFPSYIETFGLPLLEAACLGKKILASDTEFSREVLDGYSGVEYLNYKKPELWADAIELQLANKGLNREDYYFSYKPTSSWNDFFKLI
ncbi:glycosyltransferase [Endozoicomonas sp. GU-1]|uniref:glycosyltransferase n=1 Tax=Endozoicomonas sp. GU-1 TaxID=3009078 RepID=UPI0022B5BAE8|nr:glycosyltransferase [Endozoicomonas sp. GU-1]WBA84044.1 glycosyltransferase [Endozoicomonas sp. GU-1]WBA88769.1 glycosyltransferase [Endozoicomonas sp. GU-1]